jgi:hypothetical protein
MTKQMKAAMAAMMLVGTLTMHAQQTTPAKTMAKKPAPKKAPAESKTDRELRELREKQAAQQAEIDSLIQQNAAKDAALQQAQQAASTAAQQAATAQQQAATAQQQAAAATSQAQSVSATVQATSDQVQALKTNVTDLQTTNAGLASTISANKVELTDKIESPLVIRYKGLTITPVAYFAAEGVYRQRSINSDINTPFNTTPYPGSNQGHISEMNFSARQSRLGGLFEGKAKEYKLSGYFETDFLSSGTTSNDNQSNSYTLRVRQIWGKAEVPSGFAVTGGQTWSLVTEDRKSTDVRTEIQPQTIDPQYLVGYSWERQPGFRFQQKFSGADQVSGFTMAVSAEQAQTQLGTTQNAPANFVFGGVGQSGGLYNGGGSVTIGTTNSLSNLAAYANNVAPDVLVKFVYEKDKVFHIEVGGVARFFRDYYNPLIFTTTGGVTTLTGLSATIVKNDKTGGGVFGSARVYAGKFAEIAVQGMAGDGTARYGSGQLGDVTVHPDGTLEPLRNYHGLFSLETHPAPKLDIFAYYGAEYNQRTYYVSPTGSLVGFGTPNTVETGCYALTLGSSTTLTGNGVSGSPSSVSNCSPSTRDLQEGMVGFIYRAINNPKYGRLQYSATYSYLMKYAWTGVLSGTYPTGFLGSGRATNGMVHISMRYYLP